MKSAIMLFLLLVLFCCNGGRDGSTTPKEYQYKAHEVSKARYQTDTTDLRSVLTKMIDKRTRPFDLRAYDNGTNFFIDSLVYGPDQTRMIVFVVAKNSTTKLLKRENNATYYYDAFYLFSSRESVDSSIRVYDYSGYRLNFFYSYSEIREALREYCFRRLMRSDGNDIHYNIDDIRFWSSNDFEWVLNNSAATSR